MSADNPLISVVMPVYNVERYLQEVIESVLRQTYTNWELILVDDQSTDSSGMLCDEWAKKDDRIRVIHRQRNGGLSAARNTGLADARGEWILFPDSDDSIDHDTLKIMLSHTDKADVVICMLRVFPENVIYQIVNRTVYYPTFGDMEKDFTLLYNGHSLSSACTKLYRRTAIHTCFDENIRHMEDLVFNLEQLPYCKGIRIIPDVLYHYRCEAVETLSKRFWMDSVQIYQRVLRRALSFFPDNQRIRRSILQRYVHNVNQWFIELTALGGIKESEKKMLIEMQMSDALAVPELKAFYPKGMDGILWWFIKMRNPHMMYVVFCAYTKWRTERAGKKEKWKVNH